MKSAQRENVEFKGELEEIAFRLSRRVLNCCSRREIDFIDFISSRAFVSTFKAIYTFIFNQYL